MGQQREGRTVKDLRKLSPSGVQYAYNVINAAVGRLADDPAVSPHDIADALRILGRQVQQYADKLESR